MLSVVEETKICLCSRTVLVITRLHRLFSVYDIARHVMFSNWKYVFQINIIVIILLSSKLVFEKYTCAFYGQCFW